MNKKILIIILLTLATSTTAAFARDTEVLIDAKEAVERQAKGQLLGIPFYMKGQKHPNVKKTIGHWRSSKKGRGAFQSDLDACSRTFVTALKTMQQRAQKEGGNAIINITSFTKDEPFSHPSKFRCIAGSVVVHVAIEGDVVVLNK